MNNDLRVLPETDGRLDSRRRRPVEGRVSLLRIGIVLLLLVGACVRSRSVSPPVAESAVTGALDAIRTEQGRGDSVAFLVDSTSLDLIALAEGVTFATLIESLGSRAWIGLPSLEVACARSGKKECRRLSVLSWERNGRDVFARVRDLPLPQGWCTGSFSEATYHVREATTGDWRVVEESDRDFSDCGIPGRQRIDATASAVKSIMDEMRRHFSGSSGTVALVVDSASMSVIAIAEHLPPQTIVQALEGNDWIGQQAAFRFRQLNSGWRSMKDESLAMPCPHRSN